MIDLRFKKLRLSLLCLLGLFISYDVVAMDDKDIPEYLKSQQSEEVAAFIQALNKQIKPQCNADEILVYSIDPNEFISEGVCFSQDIFNLSRTLKEMKDDIHLEELKETKEVKIYQSNSAIKAAHTILIEYFNGKDKLSKKKNIKNVIKKYSFDQLIDGANCIEFLNCDLIIRDIICDEIKQRIRRDGSIIKNKNFAELNSDLQKLLMVEPIKQWLKKLIIQKYAQQRKKIIVSNPGNDYRACVGGAFNTDNSRFFFGNIPSEGDIASYDLTGNIQWKVSTPSHVNILLLSLNDKYCIYTNARENNVNVREIASGKITELVGCSNSPKSIAVSPDGTKIIAAVGRSSDLILWNIENLSNVTSIVLSGGQGVVHSVAFSSNGEKFISSDSKGIIKIWDVRTGSLIRTIDSESKNVLSSEVRFNVEGTQVIYSSRDRDKKRLILFDIVNKNAPGKEIMEQSLKIIREVVDQRNILLSSNDKEMIVLNCYEEDNNISLWDFSDDAKITHYGLAGSDDAFYSAAALSHDDTKLITANTSGVQLSYNITLYTLLTEEEKILLDNVKNYNPAWLRLLYQLCLAEKPLKNDDLILLPNNMKKLLSGLLWPSDPIRLDDDLSERTDPDSLYAPLDLLPNTSSIILPDFINRWIAKIKSFWIKKSQ